MIKFMKRVAVSAKKMAQKFNKKAVLLFTAVSASTLSFAQNTAFNSALSNATSDIRNAFPLVSTLMMVIGGVIGVIGAIRIYIKWNNGDQDVTKSIIAWAGAALFLVLSGVLIQTAFSI